MWVATNVLALLCACVGAMNGWKMQGPAQNDTFFSVRVALAQSNLQELEHILEQVSDPRSPSYTNYLSTEEVAQLVAPPQHDLDTVMQALTCDQHEVSCTLSCHRDYLTVGLSVRHASELFRVDLHTFVHPSRPSHPIIRSLAAPSLPASVRPLVSFLHGLTDFPEASARHRIASLRTGQPGEQVDPSVLRKVYGFNSSGPVQGSLSCAEFEGEQFLQSDVDAFATKYALPKTNINVVGPNDGGYFGEGILDLEYQLATAPGINITYWSIKWTEFGKDLLQWAMDVQAASHPPLVHSISWGSAESGPAGYDMPTMVRTNTEFMKMGVQGLSVLAASGDGGTGSQGLLCKKGFDPSWPATSPYVTAVGGTYLDSAGGSEVGWSDSGGGFSNLWPRPDWQAAAVSGYMKQSGLPDQQYWNSSGRAIPDVAALATNYQVIVRGSTSSESGTSASAPVFAGLIALVNSARLAAGKKSLGFLNPALYQLPSVGADIVAGNNKVAGCPAGFPALSGWDAVTGLGTPIYGQLMALA